MRTAMKRMTAALLAAMLLLGLTACGEKKEVHKVNWVTAPAYLAEDVALPVETGDLLGSCTDGAYMYILADTKTGEEVTSHLLRASLAEGEAAELDGFEATAVPDGGFKNTIGPFLAPDGTLWLYEMWSISYYDLPEDFDEAVEAKGKYFDHEECFHHLRQLDPATGRQKKLVDLSDAVRTLEVESAHDISGVAVDGRGNIYFAGTGGVAVLNNKGSYLFTLEANIPRADFSGTSGGSLALLPDGTVGVLTSQPGGKRQVRNIDVSARDWGDAQYDLPGGVDLIYGGTGGFLFYYAADGALWAWEPEGTEGRELLNWGCVQLDGVMMCFSPLDGGTLAVLSRGYSGGTGWYADSVRLSMLSPAAAKDGKIPLVYGTMKTNKLLEYRIRQFNTSNLQYYIKIRNYSELGGLAQLNAEVATGKGPDIWDESLPIDLYARKGYLEDLWPWIDGDGEVSRDTIMSHVLDCASADGKLYKVSGQFYIETLVGCADVIGSRTGWTMDEMLAAFESLPEGSTLLDPYYEENEEKLRLFLTRNLDRWIDWETGVCGFDGEEFKSILALCSGQGGGIDGELDWDNLKIRADAGEALRSGRQLLTPAELCGIYDVYFFEALCGGPEIIRDYKTRLNDANIFSLANGRYDENGNKYPDDAVYCYTLIEEDVARTEGTLRGVYPMAKGARFGTVEGSGYAAYVGYPSESGSGSVFRLYNTAAMSASCAHKDGAWAFLRRRLRPGSSGTVTIKSGSFYMQSGFPVNKEDFDLVMRPEEPWFRDANGEYVLDQNGERVKEPIEDYFASVTLIGYPVQMAVYPVSLTEEQIEGFMALYNSIDRAESDDTAVIDVIVEQAQPYFAGDKTLEETADLIQRRVTLYVNENR